MQRNCAFLVHATNHSFYRFRIVILLRTSVLILACTLSTSFPVAASELEGSSLSLVSRLIAYSKRGNGDVFVSLDNNGQQYANGYYLDKGSAGYESVLRMLLAAYQVKTPIIIYGNTSMKWSGSTSPVCEIYNVAYQ